VLTRTGKRQQNFDMYSGNQAEWNLTCLPVSIITSSEISKILKKPITFITQRKHRLELGIFAKFLFVVPWLYNC
jgi:hypothetical protein